MLDALDLPAVLRAAAGSSDASWQPSTQGAAAVQAELESWLMEPSPVLGPLLLAWSAAALHAFPDAQQRVPCLPVDATAPVPLLFGCSHLHQQLRGDMKQCKAG